MAVPLGLSMLIPGTMIEQDRIISDTWPKCIAGDRHILVQPSDDAMWQASYAGLNVSAASWEDRFELTERHAHDPANREA